MGGVAYRRNLDPDAPFSVITAKTEVIVMFFFNFCFESINAFKG